MGNSFCGERGGRGHGRRCGGNGQRKGGEPGRFIAQYKSQHVHRVKGSPWGPGDHSQYAAVASFAVLCQSSHQ